MASFLSFGHLTVRVQDSCRLSRTSSDRSGQFKVTSAKKVFTKFTQHEFQIKPSFCTISFDVSLLYPVPPPCQTPGATRSCPWVVHPEAGQRLAGDQEPAEVAVYCTVHCSVRYMPILDLGEGSLMIIVCTDYCNSKKNYG